MLDYSVLLCVWKDLILLFLKGEKNQPSSSGSHFFQCSINIKYKTVYEFEHICLHDLFIFVFMLN